MKLIKIQIRIINHYSLGRGSFCFVFGNNIYVYTQVVEPAVALLKQTGRHAVDRSTKEREQRKF